MVSYVRVLIEVDLKQKKKDKISIKDVDGRKLCQEVRYEWTPEFF